MRCSAFVVVHLMLYGARLGGLSMAAAPARVLARAAAEPLVSSHAGFHTHIRSHHNMWMYLHMIVYLREKDPTEFNGWEQHVAHMIEAEDVPAGKEKLLLSAAVGVGPGTVAAAYDIEAMHPFFDWIVRVRFVGPECSRADSDMCAARVRVLRA